MFYTEKNNSVGTEKNNSVICYRLNCRSNVFLEIFTHAALMIRQRQWPDALLTFKKNKTSKRNIFFRWITFI